MFPISVTRRNLLMGVGSAAAVAGLAACTSPTVNSDSAPSGETQSSGAPKAGGSLTLMFLGPTERTITAMNDQILPAFKEATGYDVELQSSDWGSAFQKITTGAASNSLPDVFVIGGIWTAPLASKGVLLDITERMGSWADKGEFYDGMLADGVYEDKLYAVPFAADIRSAIYRKDILEEAGVSELPTTWAEFRSAAEQVKALGDVQSPIDWNLDTSIGLQQSFAQLFLQAGGEYFDRSGKASFNSDAGFQALDFMVGTFKDGLADYNLVYTGSGPRPIVSGLSALTLNGTAVPSNATDTAPEVEELLVVGPGLKATDDSEPTSVAWVNKFAISNGTKDPDGAWQLVQSLTGAANLGTISELYGSLPPRRDLSEAEWIEGVYAEMIDTAEDATSQPRHPVMMQLGTTVKELLEPAIRGQVGVEETLAAIDSAVDALDA